MAESHEMDIIRMGEVEEEDPTPQDSPEESWETSSSEDSDEDDASIYNSDMEIEDIDYDQTEFSWWPLNLKGRPKILWYFAVNEILMGLTVGVIITRFIWNSPQPGLMGNPIVAGIKSCITFARVVVQVLFGIFLFFGLKSSSRYVTVCSLREWCRAAYFVFFEQSISLGLNITKASSRSTNEPRGFQRIQDVWGNLLDITYHVMVFFIIRYYFVQNYWWSSTSLSPSSPKRNKREWMSIDNDT